MRGPRLFSQSRDAMGTVFTIYLYAEDSQQADAVFEVAFEEVERLDEALSNYRASSELSRINRLAAREPVTTDPEVFGLIQAALDYSQRTAGAFDITVAPLMRAWGFFRGDGCYPAEEDLERAKIPVGYEKVLLDPSSRRVRFAIPGVELDLGAIGKGYAVDRTAEVLRETGVSNALIDAGSSTLLAMGAPPDKSGWSVRVPEPADRSRMISSVELRDQSLSTSGSYEKFFELEGKRYCHVMDPRTGIPVEGTLQTTLIASDGTTTDALSNAMFVLGPAEGAKMLRSIASARGMWVLESGDIVQHEWVEAQHGASVAGCVSEKPRAS